MKILLGSSGNLMVDSGVILGTTSLFMEWITRPGSLDTEKILSVLRRHLCCMIHCTKRRIQNIFGEISTRELLQKMLTTQEHAQVHSTSWLASLLRCRDNKDTYEHVPSIRENKDTYDTSRFASLLHRMMWIVTWESHSQRRILTNH